MRVEQFEYDLPPELIAQSPAAEREAARLMVVDAASAGANHSTIASLADHITPGTLVVLNDTKVLRARILGTKDGTGGRAEIFLVRRLPDGSDDARVERWHAMGRASKPLRQGSRVLKDELVAEIEGKSEEGLFIVRLTTRDGSPVTTALEKAGRVPLPPYIKRDAEAVDEERYQTVYAKRPGAVAAPTAGLHLTPALIERILARGCEIASCTLHVGLGTFQPVTVEDFDQHPMHSERFEVTPALVSAIERARARRAPVMAIGTTVVRTLESAKDPERPGHVRAGVGETRLLIQPGYRFDVVDRLLSNFHLPRSTLLALVSAFAGIEKIRSAYELGVRDRYRFFSYGDAMLLDRVRAQS